MGKNTSITIRPATADDVPAITDIYNEAILTTAATFDIDPKTVEERMKWFQDHDDRHPVLVAVVGSKVVGEEAGFVHVGTLKEVGRKFDKL